MSGHQVYRRLLPLGALAGLVLLFAGCEPIVNQPPGGGQTVVETFRYGPFNLGPGEEAEGATFSGMPRPDGAFGLKAARFDVVDENGTPVSVQDVHLHHVVMTTTARQDRLCPGRPERFIASGMERTQIWLWGPYTYLVGANDNWGSIYHVMNETPPGTPDKELYIQYTLAYQPGANATNSRPVDVYFQDVTGCGNSVYDVPGNGGPGSVHERSRSWAAPQDGLAVYSGGHLHQGGIDISLEDSTSGTPFCGAVAVYHGSGHLAGIDPCYIHEKVNAGDDLTVTARYDNSQAWSDVMGIMMTYVWWGTQ